MIAKFLSLNETTKKYQVTFDSRNQNAFRVHIGDKNVKVLANYDGIYLSKPDKDFFRKVAKDHFFIEGLKKLQTVG